MRCEKENLYSLTHYVWSFEFHGFSITWIYQGFINISPKMSPGLPSVFEKFIYECVHQDVVQRVQNKENNTCRFFYLNYEK